MRIELFRCHSALTPELSAVTLFRKRMEQIYGMNLQKTLEIHDHHDRKIDAHDVNAVDKDLICDDVQKPENQM